MNPHHVHERSEHAKTGLPTRQARLSRLGCQLVVADGLLQTGVKNRYPPCRGAPVRQEWAGKLPLGERMTLGNGVPAAAAFPLPAAARPAPRLTPRRGASKLLSVI